MGRFCHLVDSIDVAKAQATAVSLFWATHNSTLAKSRAPMLSLSSTERGRGLEEISKRARHLVLMPTITAQRHTRRPPCSVMIICHLPILTGGIEQIIDPRSVLLLSKMAGCAPSLHGGLFSNCDCRCLGWSRRVSRGSSGILPFSQKYGKTSAQIWV